MANRIDGKVIAEQTRASLAERVKKLLAAGQRAPRIDVVRVGDDPASEVYVRTKERMAREIGMDGRQHHLAATTSEPELLELLHALNEDAGVDAVLLQLPLPDHLDETRMIHAIDPDKDVDGFHRVNLGKLIRGEPVHAACTPAGIMELLRRTNVDLDGAEAVVIGRSNIVGKPVAQLLLQANSTVTMAHSRTKDLPGIVRRADIVIAAVGRPLFVRGDWLKAGAVVIDVGINRLPDGKLVGDVAFDECDHVEAITPVPGGVGPMTIAYLLHNTLELYNKKNTTL